MFVINADNVNDAWIKAKLLLNSEGIARPSRVGNVLEVPDPVTTKYMNPRERVLFDTKRNCNPFFHFFEGLWMLAGRNDVDFVSQFAARMMSFSDNGTTYHAAYGHRWRNHFGQRNQFGDGGIDQLAEVIKLLKGNNAERRAVLQMWDPVVDLGNPGKDLPCNTAVYFKIRDGRLFMTVTNRSNDIVWGCYGANCVHMSMMMEYVASMIGVDMGPYHQISDSWHAYTEFWEPYGGYDLEEGNDPYQMGHVAPYVMVKEPEFFDTDLMDWMAEPDADKTYANPLLHEVALPMYLAWKAHKAKDYELALHNASFIGATDWKLACYDWLTRIILKNTAKAVAA